jgi:hypothetical protein
MPIIQISITDNGEHWEKTVKFCRITVYHRHDFTKEPQRKPVGFQVFENSIVEVIDEDYWPDDYKTPKKMNMKIKDLLANREKLAKYDELQEWKDYFDKNVIVKAGGNGSYLYSVNELPDYIKEIIVNALYDEIQKLDEE